MFLESLCRLVNIMSAGNVPTEVAPFLCGASHTALSKKSGGFRPIAVGEIFRRLVSKCLCQCVSTLAVDVLSPLQLGVNVSLGSEAIVHAVNTLMCDSSIPSDSKWTLQVDFSNAFNSIDRELLFHEVRQRIPCLSAWLECCYSVQPVLYFGGCSLRSCCGVQQGDPLAPLAFAIALHPILEKIALEVPSLVLHCWYLDDGVVCGCKEDLLKVLSIIELHGPSRGLHLNRSKSLLYVPPDANVCVNVHPPKIPLSQEGFVLLGAPVWSDSFCQLHAMKRVKKIRDIISLLPDLGDSQVEFTLLRSCLSLPKFVFLLRTFPLPVIQDAIEAFDVVLHSAVSDIVGAQLSDWSWVKATLPVSLGGIGVRLASSYAAAAYISSVSQSSSLIVQLLDQPSPPSLLIFP